MFQSKTGKRMAVCAGMFALAWARDAMAAETVAINNGDTAWLLVCFALVMLMLPGLALFNGAMVQRKNVLSSIMHSMAALGVVGLQWVVIGYSLAFGPGNLFIGDLSQFFLAGTVSKFLGTTTATGEWIPGHWG